MPEIVCDPGFTMDQVRRQLAQLQARALGGARVGAGRGAALLEQDAKATKAYVGVTGATRASTVGYVADAAGRAQFAAAYQEASAILAKSTQHQGKPYRTPIPGPAQPDDIAIVLTVPDDYIDKLETQGAGAKAFLGPTLSQDALQVTQLIAAGSQEVLR